jgi:hypothetical protein
LGLETAADRFPHSIAADAHGEFLHSRQGFYSVEYELSSFIFWAFTLVLIYSFTAKGSFVLIALSYQGN